MIRGVRGATTVTENNEEEIMLETEKVVKAMVDANNIKAQDVSHIFFSVTSELNAGFPAKSIRELEGWTYVPVMCMQEIDVPNSLEKCIRVMMVVNTTKEQKNIEHIFHNEAVKLRPDLIQE